MLNCVQLFATPWTVANQALLSMEFFLREYWSGFPFPPAGDLPNLRIETASPACIGGSLPLEPSEKPSSTIITVNFPRS